MRALLWTVSLVCLALWSLLAFGAAGLLGAAQTSIPGLTEDPLGIGLSFADLTAWLGPVANWAILVIWAIGAIVLLAGTALVSRALRSLSRRDAGPRDYHPGMAPHAPYGRPGLIERLRGRVR